LYGYQTGLRWEFLPESIFTISASYYDYRHIEGIPNQTIFDTQYSLTAAPFRQKGNSVFDVNGLANTFNGTQNYLIGLASKFSELVGSTALDVPVFGTKHAIFDFEYVNNLGFNHDEILARTGLDLLKRTHGLQGRILFGDTSFVERYAWQGYVGYRRVEADAVVDAFTDSDFRLGGTNATGYYLGARYAFAPNTTFGVRWFSGRQIDGPPLAIDVVQVDILAAF
jgi:hypothetical protein